MKYKICFSLYLSSPSGVDKLLLSLTLIVVPGSKSELVVKFKVVKNIKIRRIRLLLKREMFKSRNVDKICIRKYFNYFSLQYKHFQFYHQRF